MPEHSASHDLKRILETAVVIAVLGAHPRTERPAFYVPAYLHAVGYRVYPVNPAKVGMTLWGRPVLASLTDIPEAVDIVNVFRRSDALPGHLDEILAMSPRPGLVWMQQGIRHQGVADQLLASGVDVVQDRCTLAEHRRLGVGR